MKHYHHEFIVNCGLRKTWDFFMNPKHIEMISPPDFNETLINCTTPKLVQGSELFVRTELFISKNWHSKIVRLEEMNLFVDEVHDSKFLKWTHEHKFISENEGRTLVSDTVQFQLGFSIFGRILEPFIFQRIKRVFSFREMKIKAVLEL